MLTETFRGQWDLWIHTQYGSVSVSPCVVQMILTITISEKNLNVFLCANVNVAVINRSCGCNLRSCNYWYIFQLCLLIWKAMQFGISKEPFVLMQILTQGAEQLVIWSEACASSLKGLWQEFFLDTLIPCFRNMQRIHLLTGSTKMQPYTLLHRWHPRLRHRRYLDIVFVSIRMLSNIIVRMRFGKFMHFLKSCFKMRIIGFVRVWCWWDGKLSIIYGHNLWKSDSIWSLGWMKSTTTCDHWQVLIICMEQSLKDWLQPRISELSRGNEAESASVICRPNYRRWSVVLSRQEGIQVTLTVFHDISCWLNVYCLENGT